MSVAVVLELAMSHREFDVVFHGPGPRGCDGTMRVAGSHRGMLWMQCDQCQHDAGVRREALVRALEEEPLSEEDLPWYQRY